MLIVSLLPLCRLRGRVQSVLRATSSSAVRRGQQVPLKTRTRKPTHQNPPLSPHRHGVEVIGDDIDFTEMFLVPRTRSVTLSGKEKTIDTKYTMFIRSENSQRYRSSHVAISETDDTRVTSRDIFQTLVNSDGYARLSTVLDADCRTMTQRMSTAWSTKHVTEVQEVVGQLRDRGLTMPITVIAESQWLNIARGLMAAPGDMIRDDASAIVSIGMERDQEGGGELQASNEPDNSGGQQGSMAGKRGDGV